MSGARSSSLRTTRSPWWLRSWATLFGLAVLTAGCGRAQRDSASVPSASPPETTVVPSRDTVATAPVALPADTLPPIHYQRVPVGGPKGLVRLEKRLGEGRFASVLELNRIDRTHVRDRDSLIVPDSTLTWDRISPFPGTIPAETDRKKLLLVSLRVQAFAAYDSGRLARWGPTSTGRESLPTPAGLYHTNWKQKQRTSTFNDEWVLKWYVNLQNFVGISLHEYELPGRPASHSCVRLLTEDAQWLYDWVEQWKLDKDPRHILQHGTPVVIFGTYAYHHRPPWKMLPEDSSATDVPLAEVDEALRTYLPRDTVRVAAVDSLRR